ncbi:EF-hand domain-containing protein [Rhizobium leucaenae]|uniref:Ca2+-binding EF-hand superfamily protein n=1 Tax=Rhizobium leucaenae TaxID=29450 RepID=A0A7W6ZUA6_9HYPH|nr:EF-hand domain-containing protein [Rhizobium leucaenae]MBB4568886.1 Ca2+-binding EF-hand superfamily protein [Rhizobium leucaenae]MBB6302037.1 Ca2+-binding EF-hand superfamily protein [Rhizobium leucaenae]
MISTAEQLVSQLMNIMLNLQANASGDDSTSDSDDSSSSASSTQQASGRIGQGGSQSDMIAAMDTNGDGSITEAEFVAARPSDVSEDQATSLFKSFDTSDTGSLTTDQLASAMQANRQPPAPPSGETPDDSQISSMFSAMDTDGNGSVSEAEFVAARPSDVSEDQATNMFDSLDTSGSGSLTESQFETAMKAGPPPAPDFSSLFSSNYQDDTTTSDLLTV